MKFLPVLLVAAATLAAAQDSKPVPPEVYRADFQIKDDAGKPRRFSMLLETGGNNSLRVGTKTPVVSSVAPNGAPAQFNYVDTGLSMDVRLRNIAGKLSLRMDLDLSSVQAGERAHTGYPPTSNVRTTVQAIVPTKKPTILASIEDPATARRLDIEVTLTQVE